MRNITTALADELKATQIELLMLIKAEFDSGTLRFWNGLGDLSYDSQTWTGSGDLLSIGPAEETSDIRAGGASFVLSGVPVDIVSYALTEDYQDRLITAWLGAVSAGSIVADPVIWFQGRMDVMELSDNGETASVTLTAENRMVDLERPRERHYTDQDQQELYSGDVGLEFATEQERRVIWGT